MKSNRNISNNRNHKISKCMMFEWKYSPNGDSEPSFESSFSSLLSTLSRREANLGKICSGPKKSNEP